MSVVYVNTFDDLLYPWLTPNDVAVSFAAYDPPFHVPGLGLSFLGPMWAGSSVPSPAATIATVPVTLGVPPFEVQLIEGTALTVSNALPYGSRTFYVSGPNALLLSRGSTFTAELTFDLPMATLNMGAHGDFWAVALNFKSGDATDRSSAVANDPANDVRVGLTCQFNDGGYIKFHGTDIVWAGPGADTYATYAGNPLTEFQLTVVMTVHQGGAISGTGTLHYGNNAPTGALTILPDPLTNLPLKADRLTAVGLALATTKGGFQDFGVRLRRFTLSIT